MEGLLLQLVETTRPKAVFGAELRVLASGRGRCATAKGGRGLPSARGRCVYDARIERGGEGMQILDRN